MIPINIGDTIGVMAPSSYVEREEIEHSKTMLESLGYKIYIHEQTYTRHNQSAGTQNEKITALHDLYKNPEINAIWAAGGGNRALPLLNDLNYDVIKENSKPLIGFSDVTALLNAITARTGIINIHGDVFKNLYKNKSQLEETLKLLSGKQRSMDLTGCKILQHGKAQGKMIGGNLSMFQYLVGTQDCPALDGVLLLLEDCSDEISRIDRMLAHLRRHKVFDSISALILGEFTDIKDTGRPFGFTLEDCVKENIHSTKLPIVMNAPFGHGIKRTAFAIGITGSIDTHKQNLSFLNAE